MEDSKAKDASMEHVEVILAAVDYPATRDELVDAANDAEVTQETVMFFEMLPDQQYENKEHVNKTMNAKKAEMDMGSDAAATDSTAKSDKSMEDISD